MTMDFDLSSLGVGAVVGALVGALATHYLTRSRSAEDRRFATFNSAAHAFREAFSTELAALESLSREKLAFDILDQALPKHEAAVSVFRRSLSERELALFEAAWLDYLHPWGWPQHPEEKKMRLIEYFSDHGGKAEEEARKSAVKNIERLLRFSEPK